MIRQDAIGQELDGVHFETFSEDLLECPIISGTQEDGGLSNTSIDDVEIGGLSISAATAHVLDAGSVAIKSIRGPPVAPPFFLLFIPVLVKKNSFIMTSAFDRRALVR